MKKMLILYGISNIIKYRILVTIYIYKELEFESV